MRRPASPPSSRWSRLLRDHGMVVVLASLCVYYAVATRTEQQPTGADAALQVARHLGSLLRETAPAPEPTESRPARAVVLVARSSAEDTAFLEGLERQLLAMPGIAVAAQVQGEPRDARVALEGLVSARRTIDFIATTPDCAGWTLLQGVRERFPALGDPRIVVPESVRWPTFLTRQNLLNVANQIAVVAILAVGMTVVIITGGIDLSVGSLIALSAVLVTVAIRDLGGGPAAGPAVLVGASAAGILLCAAVGLFSGAMIAGFRVPPFIATLAVMQVASGLAFIVARGGSIYEVPDSFTWLGRGTGWLGLPHAVVLMLALYGITHLFMTRTVLGRQIYAVGGNAEAARLSGVNVPGVLLFAYAFCGAMAGLGGVLQASQLKSGAPTYGLMYELYAIAAVVVGGTSLSGGRGKVFGTLVGALIIAVIQNGMNLTNVESYRQKVVLGAVILGAVLLDLLKQRDWPRWFRAFGSATSREVPGTITIPESRTPPSS